jgi:arylsulfatase A
MYEKVWRYWYNAKPTTDNAKADDGKCIGIGRMIENAKLMIENAWIWRLMIEKAEGIPNKQGFDEFYGFLNQGHAHKYHVDYAWHNTEKVLFPENAGGKDVTNVAEWYFEKLKDFVRENKTKPFFIYFATQLPHAELVAPEQDLKKYLNENGESIFEEVPFEGKGNYRATAISYATYAAMVSQLDRHVGELTKLLEELDIHNNTIILFTSDNGPHREGGYSPEVFNSNGGLRGIKRDLYEGGIRVPFIIKWSGKVNPGSTSNYPLAFWDFLPTVADILGVKAPKGIDGVSALPVFKGENVERPNALYWEFIAPSNQVRMAVRDGKWKAVVYGLENNFQLYDLEADPSEKTNLASKYPEKVLELKKKIKETRTQSNFWPMDESLLEKALNNN